MGFLFLYTGVLLYTKLLLYTRIKLGLYLFGFLWYDKSITNI